MADHSLKWTKRILYDVLVKDVSFTFLADFIILNCEVDFEVPIIFVKPFLATRIVLVDIEFTDLIFRLNNKVVKLNIF